MAAGIILTIVITLNILVLGPSLTAGNIAPSYALAKLINIGDIITRIEAIVGLIWFITVFIRTTIYFYVATVVFAKIFELKDYRPLILPLGMIMLTFSFIIFPESVSIGKFGCFMQRFTVY